MSNTKANNNRKWWVLAGATLHYLATVADGPNFNAALPTIQEYFDASAGQTNSSPKQQKLSTMRNTT